MSPAIQAQPPKPPPPPKVEAAAPKPEAQAQAKAAPPAPKPVQTPDTFDLKASGKAFPSNGGSSFSPTASSAFTSQSGSQRVQDLQARISSLASLTSVAGLPSPQSVKLSGDRGGAASGIADNRFFSRSETVQADQFQSNFGSTIAGGGTNLSYLNARGSGSNPISSSQPSRTEDNDPRRQSLSNLFNFSFNSHSHHLFSWFGNATAGGGGAAGGIADRSRSGW